MQKVINTPNHNSEKDFFALFFIGQCFINIAATSIFALISKNLQQIYIKC